MLVGSVTEREPEFSREDVEAFIALMESQRVGPHGHPMSEATSPLADPSNPNRKWEYVTPLPEVDFATAAKNATIDKYRAAYPDADMSSLLWRVEKREL